MEEVKKERDYIARLVVYGLPDMDKRECQRLFNWLKTLQKVAKKPGDFSGKFVARLIK